MNINNINDLNKMTYLSTGLYENPFTICAQADRVEWLLNFPPACEVYGAKGETLGRERGVGRG